MQKLFTIHTSGHSTETIRRTDFRSSKKTTIHKSARESLTFTLTSLIWNPSGRLTEESLTFTLTSMTWYPSGRLTEKSLTLH